MPQPITARAIVFNPNGKLLVMYREKNSEQYYALPGGHVEPDETPEAAVTREVLEETTLGVDVAKLLYTGTDGLGNINYIFLCNYRSGEPALPPNSPEAAIDAAQDELHQPMWVAPEHLHGVTMYPPNLIELLEEDITNNFQFNPRPLA